MGRPRPGRTCGPHGYLSIVATADFQARSDLIKYQFQRDYSG